MTNRNIENANNENEDGMRRNGDNYESHHISQKNFAHTHHFIK